MSNPTSAVLKAAGFGVRLLIPAGHYPTTLRAAKYAILFLDLVFPGYFLFEVFAVLCVLYVFLYIVLKAEDYALLMGAGGLFLILASVMFITRNIDWHVLRDGLDSGVPPVHEGRA